MSSPNPLIREGDDGVERCVDCGGTAAECFCDDDDICDCNHVRGEMCNVCEGLDWEIEPDNDDDDWEPDDGME